MPTYAFTRTREQLARLILGKLGVLAAGETPSAEDAQLVYDAIDMRLKMMHAKGVFWRNVSPAATDLAITGGSATVAASADVLYPVTFQIRVNGEDSPLDIIGHREYQEIPNKEDTGTPEKVLFVNGAYYLWPVPDIDYTGKVTFQQVAADTAASTAPDVEPSMLLCLRNIVCYDLSDDFTLPEYKIARFKIEKEEAERAINAINQQRTDTATVTPEYF